MQTKISYTKKIKELYAFNQAYIQKIVNLPNLEYYEMEFETGCLFLEQLFPRKFLWDNYYKAHAYQKEFWIWWKAEWKKWERGLIDYLKINQVKITKQLWMEEMHKLLQDGYVESSFHKNYLKVINYK